MDDIVTGEDWYMLDAKYVSEITDMEKWAGQNLEVLQNQGITYMMVAA